jgi:hypothetical protein
MRDTYKQDYLAQAERYTNSGFGQFDELIDEARVRAPTYSRSKSASVGALARGCRGASRLRGLAQRNRRGNRQAQCRRAMPPEQGFIGAQASLQQGFDLACSGKRYCSRCCHAAIRLRLATLSQRLEAMREKGLFQRGVEIRGALRQQ